MNWLPLNTVCGQLFDTCHLTDNGCSLCQFLQLAFSPEFEEVKGELMEGGEGLEGESLRELFQ